MMPKDWKRYKLGDVLELKKKTIPPKQFNGEAYIGLEHIGQGNFLLEGVGNALDVTSSKNIFDKGDILYGKIRPYFKKVYRPLFSGICSTDILVIRTKDEKVVSQDFLYHVIKTQGFTDRATETSSGTKMPRADWGSLKNLVYPLPPLPEQKAIASILSALDDKIELNLQQNKTLEEMAMALYKHWFVDFGPFQDDEFIESELGLIPKGWEVKSLNEISKDHNKYREPISTRKRAEISGSYPYYGATKILDYIDHFNFDGQYILVAEDGTVKTDRDTPYLQFINGQFCVSNHAHILTGDSGYSNYYLYLALSNTYVIPFITGAVQLKISKGNLQKMQFAIAPSEEMKSFNSQVQPLYEMIHQNESENQTLTSLRDTLLPKLISGEIRVKDAKKIVADL